MRARGREQCSGQCRAHVVWRLAYTFAAPVRMRLSTRNSSLVRTGLWLGSYMRTVPLLYTLGFSHSGSSPSVRWREIQDEIQKSPSGAVRKIRTGPKQLMGPAVRYLGLTTHISIFAGFRHAAHEEAELLDWIKATKVKRQAKDPDHTQNKSQSSENNGHTISRCPRPAFCV